MTTLQQDSADEPIPLGGTHYQRNKEYYRTRNNKQRLEKREWLNTIKSVPCMDCGVSYPPYVMDFDHRDASQKIAQVSQLLLSGWPALKREVEKCDIVCSNCHRIRTHSRRMM